LADYSNHFSLLEPFCAGDCGYYAIIGDYFTV